VFSRSTDDTLTIGISEITEAGAETLPALKIATLLDFAYPQT
jgi:hypothetical protein